MTVLYSNDFEGGSHLGTLAAFTSIAGSAFIIIDEGSFGAMPASQGVKSYAAADNGDRNYWNGGSDIGDQAMRTSAYLITSHCVGHMLRVNSGVSDQGYWFFYEYSGGNLRGTIDVRNSGSAATSSGSYDIAATTGDTIHMESRAVGTSLELRVWVNGASRPGTATVSMTRSDYSTGKQGLRKAGSSGTYASVDELVITDSAGGEDTFYPGGGGGSIAAISNRYLRSRRA